MSLSIKYDVVIVGGGIIGTSIAMHLLRKKKLSLLLIESEGHLAAHQTGNNSGVIHSGLYYKPQSLKAINCAKGREQMYAFCAEHSIPYDKCGKIVVATSPDEIPALNELESRGLANGLKGIRRLKPEEIKEFEPNAAGIDGLFVSQTGIVDYVKVTERYASIAEGYGAEISKNCKFITLADKQEMIVHTSRGEFKTNFLVNCAGLQADRVATECGINHGVQIIPFRGEYYTLKKESEHLVRNLIYPVPDPRFPFLGVHFTRLIDGRREAGPNAVLALQREGYKKTDFSVKDMLEYLAFPGFWRMARKHYLMGMQEYVRSFSRTVFVTSLQKLIPAITAEDIAAGGAGVRAQALDKSGKLLDDFCLFRTEHMLHVLNAPSPAATASLSIGDTISDSVINSLNIKK